MDLQLAGKVVFLTGASGGIGRALARVFAAEGCRLALHAHANIAWLREFITAQNWQDRALALAADVADPDAVHAAMDAAAKHFGRVDICVANAGKWPQPDEMIHQISVSRMRHTIDVNLYGAIWTARAFFSHLKPRSDNHGASLTFIGSTAGRFGERGHVDYSLSKAGLYGLVRTLKNEITQLDPFGRVNMVEPGWTVTEMAREALDREGTIRRVVKTMPLRQLARAADIARVVAVLSSPAVSRHISGEVVTVAGGMEGRLLWGDNDIDEAAVRARARES
ncbi:MAG: SDR family oxidoreductase [Planctomycetes bacterium]|nr:SDR family oxidoreductase [Planctomycetota bacterium]MCL4731780.1 SDR family oxidoreductase [Planctomycetota bacterium]